MTSVIEVSFKTNEESIATKQRELLMASLEKKRLVVTER